MIRAAAIQPRSLPFSLAAQIHARPDHQPVSQGNLFVGYPIVITCDRTMASSYHGLMFLGFSACIPTGTLPEWVYYPLFCPNAPADAEGRLRFANAGMRRIEAALLANGFRREDIIVAHPEHLDKAVTADTKIISISSNDPLGVGPATSTFVEIWGGEGRMAHKLRELLNHLSIKKHRPFIFLGGPGAWQLSVNEAKQKALGVDCVVVGEGEITAPKLFRQVLDGGRASLPRTVDGEPVPLEQIPDIVGGTTIGLVEATRGCARSCAFCVPSVKKVRSRPVERILAEVQVNMDAGNTGVILHGEDMLLYQSDGLKVNSEAVTNLFERVHSAPGVKFMGISHVSLSSIVSSPQTVQDISRIMELGTKRRPVNYYQVGIETGSPKLIGRHMRGKVFPYAPEEWPHVVREGFRISHENHFVCCATIIMGLPGEEPDDVQQTIDVVRSLKPYKCVIIPLLFTPMLTTRLEYATAFHKGDLTALHDELVTACWDHNLTWAQPIWTDYGHNAHPVLKASVGLVARYGPRLLRNQILRNAKRRKNGGVRA